MFLPDIINGIFEFLGAPFILFSIIKLYKEKQVRGVSWSTVTFMTSWGLWNLYYYPCIGQWASFTGGAVLVCVNIIWLGQIFYYSTKERNGKC